MLCMVHGPSWSMDRPLHSPDINGSPKTGSIGETMVKKFGDCLDALAFFVGMFGVSSVSYRGSIGAL